MEKSCQMKPVILLLAVILALTLYNRKESPLPRPLSNPVILAFGDSLTYGYGSSDPQRRSYPARLEGLTGRPVINAGVNGETSGEGLRRIDALLKRHRPGLTLLCLGGNDILRRIPRKQTKENLHRIIKKIRATGSEVLLIAVPDLSLLGLHDLSLYDELARELKVPLAGDVLGPILSDPSFKSDPIHPNDRGYMHMAEKIYKVIKEEGLHSEKE